MARRQLNNIFIFITFTLLSASSFASCEDVLFLSETGKKEKAPTCFKGDPTYFLSQNCQDLSCEFARDLKKIDPEVEAGMRPGAILCEKLGGLLETVTYERVKFTVRRCLFQKDKSFISLNLLESWDGKRFKGPSEPIDF